MKYWQPELIYRIKPWALMAAGGLTAIGAVAWSLFEGNWTPGRSFACLVGAGLAIGGGAILQMRQNYRVRSKWARAHPRDE